MGVIICERRIKKLPLQESFFACDIASRIEDGCTGKKSTSALQSEQGMRHGSYSYVGDAMQQQQQPFCALRGRESGRTGGLSAAAGQRPTF